ncbi:MAG: energy-coupling factor ABC transporter ATP-binding protein [Phascolarctobacterium sp.]|nr:energy-coupling factor ABC transporter ATP-binding protein [Phascolarctobacterium sp.]
MMDGVIRIEDFYFAYKRSGIVLNNINLAVRKGSFTVITGPSGAGKTTLCKAMTGIIPYYMGGRYSGDVKILGETTKGRRISDIAMRVGFIMEDYESQLISLTAGEEVSFGLLNHGFSPSEIDARVKRALEDVGLPGRKNYQLDELSGGQKQRLLLATVLAVHPEIIVLDEPVSALDPDGAISLYKQVSDIHKRYGTTIVTVEHCMDYMLPYVTDMIVLKEGNLVAVDAFQAAAGEMYKDGELRMLLPSLWQVKFGLEEKTGISFGEWRSEEEAICELKKYNFTGRAD